MKDLLLRIPNVDIDMRCVRIGDVQLDIGPVAMVKGQQYLGKEVPYLILWESSAR